MCLAFHLWLLLEASLLSCPTNMESSMTLLQHNRHTDYRRLEWSANSLLQIQRLAHEEAGFGTWDNCTADIPTTKGSQTLALLNISDAKHPRLIASEPA
jgi:hypothetical protein